MANENSDSIKNFKATDTSGLQERIAKMESDIEGIKTMTKLAIENSKGIEEKITNFYDKEIGKIYEILNKNPLQ